MTDDRLTFTSNACEVLVSMHTMCNTVLRETTDRITNDFLAGRTTGVEYQDDLNEMNYSYAEMAKSLAICMQTMFACSGRVTAVNHGMGVEIDGRLTIGIVFHPTGKDGFGSWSCNS